MQLSEDQKQEVLAARRTFFKLWGALLQERMCLEGVMKARHQTCCKLEHM